MRGASIEALGQRRGATHGYRLHCLGRRDLRGVRPLCRPLEAHLTMIVSLIYAAGAIVITLYMLAALLRPDKF